jgi:hypothetical protein
MKDSEILEEIQEYKENLSSLRDIFIKNKIPDLQDLMMEYLELVGMLRNYLLLVREGSPQLNFIHLTLIIC